MRLVIIALLASLYILPANAFGNRCEFYKWKEINYIKWSMFWQHWPWKSDLYRRKADYWANRSIRAGCEAMIQPLPQPLPEKPKSSVVPQRNLQVMPK